MRRVFPRNWIFSHHWLIIIILCTNSHCMWHNKTVSSFLTSMSSQKLVEPFTTLYIKLPSIDYQKITLIFFFISSIYIVFIYAHLLETWCSMVWFYKYVSSFLVKRSNERLFKRGHKILPIMCHKCELCIINLTQLLKSKTTMCNYPKAHKKKFWPSK